MDVLVSSDVKSLKPKWPRGQNFGLRLKDLSLAAKLRPWPQTFGFGLALILLSYYVIGHFFGKNRVKFVNFANFPAIILNPMLLIIGTFFIIILGLGLCFNLQKLA